MIVDELGVEVEDRVRVRIGIGIKIGVEGRRNVRHYGRRLACRHRGHCPKAMEHAEGRFQAIGDERDALRRDIDVTVAAQRSAPKQFIETARRRGFLIASSSSSALICRVQAERMMRSARTRSSRLRGASSRASVPENWVNRSSVPESGVHVPRSPRFEPNGMNCPELRSIAKSFPECVSSERPGLAVEPNHAPATDIILGSRVDRPVKMGELGKYFVRRTLDSTQSFVTKRIRMNPGWVKKIFLVRSIFVCPTGCTGGRRDRKTGRRGLQRFGARSCSAAAEGAAGGSAGGVAVRDD